MFYLLFGKCNWIFLWLFCLENILVLSSQLRTMFLTFVRKGFLFGKSSWYGSLSQKTQLGTCITEERARIMSLGLDFVAYVVNSGRQADMGSLALGSVPRREKCSLPTLWLR